MISWRKTYAVEWIKGMHIGEINYSEINPKTLREGYKLRQYHIESVRKFGAAPLRSIEPKTIVIFKKEEVFSKFSSEFKIFVRWKMLGKRENEPDFCAKN